MSLHDDDAPSMRELLPPHKRPLWDAFWKMVLDRAEAKLIAEDEARPRTGPESEAES